MQASRAGRIADSSFLLRRWPLPGLTCRAKKSLPFAPDGVRFTSISLSPQAFPGHRGAIYSLSFREGTRTLYSASEDRCLKIWSLEDMSYVDTLYGALFSSLT